MLLIECPYCGPRASPNSPAAARPTSRARCIPNNSPTVNGATTCSCAGIPVARIASSGCTRRAVAAGSGAARYRQLPDPGLRDLRAGRVRRRGRCRRAGRCAMKQVDRLEAGGASTVPSPCISRSTAWRTRATRATRWPRRCWPMACVSSPAASSITARAASSRRGGGAQRRRAARSRAIQRAECARHRDRAVPGPGGVQRECGTVAGARPPGHQPAAGALPARRLLLQDLHVAAPPVAPLRGQDPRGRRPGSAPDARDAERYDKRYAHCDVLVLGGGPAGLAAADAAAATGARVILVDEQRELGGSLLSCRPRSTASRHCAGPGASRRACGSGLMSGS